MLPARAFAACPTARQLLILPAVIESFLPTRGGNVRAPAPAEPPGSTPHACPQHAGTSLLGHRGGSPVPRRARRRDEAPAAPSIIPGEQWWPWRIPEAPHYANSHRKIPKMCWAAVPGHPQPHDPLRISKWPGPGRAERLPKVQAPCWDAGRRPHSSPVREGRQLLSSPSIYPSQQGIVSVLLCNNSGPLHRSGVLERGSRLLCKRLRRDGETEAPGQEMLRWGYGQPMAAWLCPELAARPPSPWQS